MLRVVGILALATILFADDIISLSGCTNDICVINSNNFNNTKAPLTLSQKLGTIVVDSGVNFNGAASFLQLNGIAAQIETFMNSGILNPTSPSPAINLNNRTINSFINSGEIRADSSVSFGGGNIRTLINQGTMSTLGSFEASESGGIVDLINSGKIIASNKNGFYAHIANIEINKIQQWNIDFDVSAQDFNTFYQSQSGKQDSHIIFYNSKNDGKLAKDYLSFQNGAITLNIANATNISIDSPYALNRLIVSQIEGEQFLQSGGFSNDLVFSFLKLGAQTTPALYLTRYDEGNFALSTSPQKAIKTSLNMTNITSMRNFIFKSNFAIFHKQKPKQNLRNNNPRLALNFVANEAFYKDFELAANMYPNIDYRYKNLKSTYQKGAQNNPPRYAPINKPRQTQRWHLFLSPFVGVDKYNDDLGLGGFNTGFVGGFSGKINNFSALGIHAAFSYGMLRASEIELSNLGFDLGLHYKLDFIYDFYLKARLDGFIFSNEINLGGLKQSPKSQGFGAFVGFGKDFKTQIGEFGLEVGAHYNALFNGAFNIGGEAANRGVLNIGYGNIELGYMNSFINGNLGFNALVGAEMRFNALNDEIIILGQNINYRANNDRFSGYFGLGASYLGGENVELGIDYLGRFGNVSMNHSGFINIRAWW